MFGWLHNVKFILSDEELKFSDGKVKVEKKDDKILGISNEDGVITIDIKKKCTKEEYSDNFGKVEIDFEIPNIPLNLFLFTADDKLKSILVEQKIHILENNNFKYFISVSDNHLKILERMVKDEHIHEVVFDLELINGLYKYTVSKYIHDLNLSTKQCKFYPAKNNVNKFFALDKAETLNLVKNLLDNLNSIKDINEYLDLFFLYERLDLVNSMFYYPVISDEVLTLSWGHWDNKKEINKQFDEHFDIILNETKEVVGDISFDYLRSSGFTYGGNVSYSIKEKFRGNYYATRALTLLKELLKENKFTGDKDLYISTVPENEISQKVIINNDGNLVYDGDVPEDDDIYCFDGVKKVRVYRIKI